MQFRLYKILSALALAQIVLVTLSFILVVLSIGSAGCP